VLGAILCVYLASPLSGRATADYKIAGWLMLIGVGLWAVTWLLNKYVFNRHAEFDPSHIDSSGPVN
jgi:basic amino acid/polyamine antiporter, APA family